METNLRDWSPVTGTASSARPAAHHMHRLRMADQNLDRAAHTRQTRAPAVRASTHRTRAPKQRARPRWDHSTSAPIEHHIIVAATRPIGGHQPDGGGGVRHRSELIAGCLSRRSSTGRFPSAVNMQCPGVPNRRPTSPALRRGQPRSGPRLSPRRQKPSEALASTACDYAHRRRRCAGSLGRQPPASALWTGGTGPG
jgi:hypothetical protein